MRSWVIDNVFPEEVVGLLVGSPGVGKSSAGIKWLAEIKSGLPVFGHQSHPRPIVYVSCDRSEAEYTSHLEALGYSPDIFHFYDQTSNKTSIDVVIRACSRKFPHCLIFIDGMARLVPDCKLSDYGVVSDFLVETGRLCREFHVTVLGCIHASKQKDGQSYSDPRDISCGSTAWSGFSNLNIVIQRKNPSDPSDPLRIIHLLTRSRLGDVMLTYQKDPSSAGGSLIPYDDPVEADLLGLHLMDLPYDQPFPKKEMVEFAKSQSITERRVERWLERMIGDGMVEKVSRGVYRRIRPS